MGETLGRRGLWRTMNVPWPSPWISLPLKVRLVITVIHVLKSLIQLLYSAVTNGSAQNKMSGGYGVYTKTESRGSPCPCGTVHYMNSVLTMNMYDRDYHSVIR